MVQVMWTIKQHRCCLLFVDSSNSLRKDGYRIIGLLIIYIYV